MIDTLVFPAEPACRKHTSLVFPAEPACGKNTCSMTDHRKTPEKKEGRLPRRLTDPVWLTCQVCHPLTPRHLPSKFNTARVMVNAPVLIVGSGTGAYWSECRDGN